MVAGSVAPRPVYTQQHSAAHRMGWRRCQSGKGSQGWGRGTSPLNYSRHPPPPPRLLSPPPRYLGGIVQQLRRGSKEKEKAERVVVGAARSSGTPEESQGPSP